MYSVNNVRRSLLKLTMNHLKRLARMASINPLLNLRQKQTHSGLYQDLVEKWASGLVEIKSNECKMTAVVFTHFI